MVSFLIILILGLGDRPIAVPRETWSNVPTISALKCVLRHDVGVLKEKEFDMYKANLSFDEAKEIILSGVRDPRFQRLDEWLESPAKFWPNYWFDPYRVHIIIELTRATELPLNLQSVPPGVRDLAKIQAATIKYLNGRESPSQAAKPSNLASIQTGEHAIRNGRPYSLTGRPISLYNPVFDEFKAAAARPPAIEYINGTGAEIFEFIRESREVYRDDDSRLSLLGSCLGQLLEFDLSRERVPRCVNGDDVARCRGSYLLMYESKNEIGTGGCDPSVQAAFSYSKYWGQGAMKPLRESCCCPSFIITVAGPWMCVLGAIFLEEPVVEPLTDFIWIGPRDCFSNGIESVARIFQPLGTSLKSLRSFYDNLEKGEAPGRFFPWITYFLDGDDHKINFQYIGALGGEYHQRKAVFKAQTIEPNPRTVVVKFTRRYNGQAHKLLAEHGYAPKLLFDGSEHPEFPRPAGLLMMVMEFIIEAPQGPRYDKAYSTLRTALDLLHDRGLVFGDLRSLNVLVPKRPTDQEVKPMLIDFDWCGKDRVDRYPLEINTEIFWADGVGPGTLMLKHHDDFMLEKMLS